MRIAFMGSRGIPRCYSGFETFVEEISVRLVQRGHEVTVYNRIPFNPYREKTFKGVEIVHIPTLQTKVTDTIVHTLLSVLHSLGRSYDIVYFCGVGNALWAFVPRFKGAKTLVNVDGADFARAKWSGFGRWWLRKSEQWAARLSDVIIADHPSIRRRYRDNFGIEAELIPYGAKVVTEDPGVETLEKFRLEKNGYFLYVSRLTPENAADITIEAYLKSGVILPLVVVGDAPYQGTFLQSLKDLAAQSTRVIMTGYLFGLGYEQLSFHARAFVYPTAIDATRPVLLDQMGFGNCIIARDTSANLQITESAALTFAGADPLSSLAEAFRTVESNPELAAGLGQLAQARIRDHYDWEVITGDYEKLFKRLLEI